MYVTDRPQVKTAEIHGYNHKLNAHIVTDPCYSPDSQTYVYQIDALLSHTQQAKIIYTANHCSDYTARRIVREVLGDQWVVQHLRFWNPLDLATSDSSYESYFENLMVGDNYNEF